MIKTKVESLLGHELNYAMRRALIIEEMDSLISSGKDCSSCSGMCCTYEFNSMKITPLEALDIIYDLSTKEDFNYQAVVSLLKDNISHFRLDKDFASLGTKNFRRYYTCPFFKQKSLGCSISKELKPYGCIAFNPNSKNVSTQNKCSSQVEVLLARFEQLKLTESVINKRLKEELNIYWDSSPISTGVLEVLEKLNTSATS